MDSVLHTPVYHRQGVIFCMLCLSCSGPRVRPNTCSAGAREAYDAAAEPLYRLRAAGSALPGMGGIFGKLGSVGSIKSHAWPRLV
jgi:hypothetical protein